MKQEKKAKAKRYSIRISNKLSGMLRAAVADKNSAKADPRYRLNMSVWHEPSRRGTVCEVCMAGAVLAMRTEVPQGAGISAFEYEESNLITELTARKMRAINYMRHGSMSNAAATMGIARTDEQYQAVDRAADLIRVNYDYTKDLAPDAIYFEAADILKAAGL